MNIPKQILELYVEGKIRIVGTPQNPNTVYIENVEATNETNR